MTPTPTGAFVPAAAEHSAAADSGGYTYPAPPPILRRRWRTATFLFWLLSCQPTSGTVCHDQSEQRHYPAVCWPLISQFLRRKVSQIAIYPQ